MAMQLPLHAPGLQQHRSQLPCASCCLCAAELMLRKPWLPGNSDIDQLGKIFQALGTPSKDNWPGLTALPNYVEFKPQVAPPLRQQFPQVGGMSLD